MFLFLWVTINIINDINTISCPIKVNSNEIKLTVHTYCYCVLDLLCVTTYILQVVLGLYQPGLRFTNFATLMQVWDDGGCCEVVTLPVSRTANFSSQNIRDYLNPSMFQTNWNFDLKVISQKPTRKLFTWKGVVGCER